MKQKLLQFLGKSSKLTLYGLLIGCTFSNLILAEKSSGQKYKSVKDVYLYVGFENVNLNEAFKIVEENTAFFFTINDHEIDENLRINKAASKRSVADLLTYISKRARLKFKQVNNNISVSTNPSNKDNKIDIIIHEAIAVSGTVLDENDEPLIGVNVKIKGLSQGTITDAEGKYSLEVPDENSVLVFSFIGYTKQEIAVGSQSQINVKMLPNTSELSEVVVTALGIERNKESLSYAVSELSGGEVSDKSEPDVLRALSGKVAGVNISGSGGASGSSTNIVIRGNNSATGNNQPLFVVDGIPFDNTTNNSSDPADAASTYSNRALDLDPNDIASISVLKGGAAAALYGSRASNGVIIITTHSGGGSQKGLEIELSSTVSFESIARLPKYQNKYGQGNFTNGQYTFSPVATESWGPAFNSSDLDGNGGLFNQDGTIVYTNHVGDVVPYRAYPDNVKEFYQTGLHLENSVRIRGGDGQNGFALTASNVDNEGFIPNTGLKRTSVKLSGNSVLQNGVMLNASITYVNNHQDGILSGGHNTLSSINRQTLFIPRNYDLTGLPYIDPVTGGQLQFSFWDNPRWLVQEGPYDSDVNRVYGFVSAQYDINDWLNVSYKIGTNTYADKRSQIIPRGSFFTNGSIINHDISFTEISSNLIVTGTKDFSEDLNLRFIVGHNYNQRKTDENNFGGTGIIKRGITRISNVESVVNNVSRFTNRKIVGVFTDLTLTYKDYLFLNLTGRNDWSSTLPEDSRSFFYPSVSTALVFTEALDLKSNILSYGKVRAAFAQIGNDADPYLLSTVNVINGNAGNVQLPFNGVSGTTIGNNLGNLNLKPEFTTEIEFGLDLKFLNNKVGLDIAYYTKTTKDQIFSVNIPSVSGYLTKTLNAGEISNKGVEFALDVTPLNKNGIYWNVLTTFSKNISKVEKLIDGLDQINPGFRQGTYGNVLKVGHPYGAIEGEIQVRDDEGNLLINPVTGLPSKTADLHIVGDPNPDFMVGISNTISYKGFSLGFLLDWKQGGDILALSTGYLRGFGISEETAVDRNRTYILPGYLADPTDPTAPLLDGDNNKIPNDIQISPQSYWSAAVSGSHSNQYRFSSEAYIFDATVFRLRELSLSYNIPKQLLEKLPFGSASITLVGRNLWFLAPNLPHLDPEVSTYGAGNVQGIEQYAPPTVKNYGVNVKLTF